MCLASDPTNQLDFSIPQSQAFTAFIPLPFSISRFQVQILAPLLFFSIFCIQAYSQLSPKKANTCQIYWNLKRHSFLRHLAIRLL